MVVNKTLSRYFDLRYFFWFAIILAGFYYFNIFYLGITDPNNYYVPFLDHNLNYISWFTSSILKTAQLFGRLFNMDAVVNGKNIYISNGASVMLNYTCLGLGVTSFWIAFILADNTGWKKKILWSLFGCVAIWFINCWRITILLLSLQNKWESNKYIDHHGMFNIACYIIIFSLIYWYGRTNKKLSQDEGTSKDKKIQLKQSYPQQIP